MPGLSIHVVDVSAGVVAVGMAVEVYSSPSEQIIAAGTISRRGLLEHAALDQRLAAGVYTARFHIADYYRRAGISLPAIPFLDVVAYRFGIADPEMHYHLPMKCTPWGYSCFRGGA